MNTQYTIHTRAGRGFLNFGIIGVYSNPNLSLPNGVVTSEDKEIVKAFKSNLDDVIKLGKQLSKAKLNTKDILNNPDAVGA
jgi:hypothetical protein